MLFIRKHYFLLIILVVFFIFYLHSTGYTDVTPLSERKPQVTEAILNVVKLDYPNVSTYADITETHLAAPTELYLNNKSITVLKSEDFDGMTGLTSLNLYSNRLSILPDGIFEGLTAVTIPRLGGNTIDPMQIGIYLENAKGNNYKLVVPTSEPFAITVSVVPRDGVISEGLGNQTVSTGSVESAFFTAPSVSGATVEIGGTLPSLPQNHYGYEVVKTDPRDHTETSTDETATENNAPVFTEGETETVTRSVAENTAAAINIGTPITATDLDTDDILTYTLSGTDVASFDIVNTSGQLQTKAPLDYETKNAYTVTVTVSDGNNGSDSITVTINVTDVDETTIDPPLSERTQEVQEAIVNAISGVDFESDVTAADLASITSLDLRSKSITSLKSGDFENLTSLRELHLAYNSISDLSPLQNLTNLRVLHLAYNSISDLSPLQNLTNLRVLHLFSNSISDLSPLQNLTNLRELHLAYNSISDLSPLQNLTNLRVLNLFSNSISDLSPLQNLTNLRELRLFSNFISDLSPLQNLTSLRVLRLYSNSISDLSPLQNLTSLRVLHLSDNSISDLSPLQNLTSLRALYLAENSISDYGPLRRLIAAIEASGGRLSLDIEIPDVAVNNAPTFTDGAATTRSIAENTGSGIDIGSPVFATDPDNDDLEYSLGGTDASSFSIVSTSGQLQTKATLDYETKTPYSVTISVSDEKGGTDSITVTINVTNVNEAPSFTDGTSTARSIAENTGSGIDIGSPVFATDPDNDDLEYSLGGTDASSFSIVSTSGQLQTKATLDYETKTPYSVTISVSDEKGGTDSITVTINVTNVNEAPSFTDGTSTARSIAENTGSGINIGSPVFATDPDNDDLEYSLGGTDASSFSIVSTSGQLQTKAALDYETKTPYSVTISVSDKKGGTDSITVTINVTNVNEAPSFTDGTSTARSIAENTSSGQNIGSPVSATDPDNDDLEYSLGGTDASSFSIVSTSGQLQTKAALDYETKTPYSVTISVSDEKGGTDSITVTINVTNVNEAPSFTDGTSTARSIAENTGSGINIGSPVFATDPDNDDIEYSLGGTDASSFSIVSTSGQLRTSASLNYESKLSHSVTISVSDEKGGTDSITVTINVTNVNEAPSFTDGTSTARSIAENTGSGIDIGSPVFRKLIQITTT